MIRKSEKLACAYIALVGEKYDGAFTLKNLLFTAQEIITKANELFGENIRANIFQTIHCRCPIVMRGLWYIAML